MESKQPEIDPTGVDQDTADYEPTCECMRWDTQMDGGNPQMFAKKAEIGMVGM